MFYANFIAPPFFSVQGHLLNENKVSVAQGEKCDVRKEVSEIKELLVNATKDLHEMRNEFGKEIKAIWKYLKLEERSSKNVSASQPKNKCKSYSVKFVNPRGARLFLSFMTFICKDN